VTTKDIAENISKVSTGIQEMTSSVVTSSEAVTEANRLISDSAQLAKLVAESMTEISKESDSIKADSTKVYASGMEVASLGKDIEQLITTFNLPQQFISQSQQGARKFISFTSQYSLGISGIDEQHKKIMDYINQIHAAVKKDKALDEIKKILGDLTQFTVDHFAVEEKYFDQFNYPDTTKHKAIHQKLLEQVTNVITEINEGQDVNLIEVLIFLKNWLSTHILVEDKRYAPFLIKNGVK